MTERLAPQRLMRRPDLDDRCRKCAIRDRALEHLACRGECRRHGEPYGDPPAPAACWVLVRRSGSGMTLPSEDNNTVSVDRSRYPTRSTMPRSSHERHAWKCSPSETSAPPRAPTAIETA